MKTVISVKDEIETLLKLNGFNRKERRRYMKSLRLQAKTECKHHHEKV